jgi:hypothetical protein
LVPVAIWWRSDDAPRTFDMHHPRNVYPAYHVTPSGISVPIVFHHCILPLDNGIRHHRRVRWLCLTPLRRFRMLPLASVASAAESGVPRPSTPPLVPSGTLRTSSASVVGAGSESFAVLQWRSKHIAMSEGRRPRATRSLTAHTRTSIPQRRNGLIVCRVG